MVDEMADRLLELEKENKQLEQVMASPSPVRLTEHAAAIRDHEVSCSTQLSICVQDAKRQRWMRHG
jgi:hypothetical protein